MISNELITFVKQQEGCILHPYRDQAGLLTIGYGHRIDSECEPWTQSQADEHLRSDLEAKLDALLSISKGLRNASQRRQDALTDFIFNLGEGAYARSTLRKFVDQQDWSSAAKEIQKWCHAGGRVLDELQARRKIESEWLISG